MVGYAASRLVVLFGDGNPVYSTNIIEDKYDLGTKFDLDEFGFQIAFQVERIEIDE